jgi:hypothetical protein
LETIRIANVDFIKIVLKLYPVLRFYSNSVEQESLRKAVRLSIDLSHNDFLEYLLSRQDVLLQLKEEDWLHVLNYCSLYDKELAESLLKNPPSTLKEEFLDSLLEHHLDHLKPTLIELIKFLRPLKRLKIKP